MAESQPSSSLNEEWRPIPGWEGYYEASSNGRVRSLERQVKYADGRVATFQGIVLRQSLNSNGRYSVMLCRSGKNSTRTVHKLVLESFRGNRPPGMDSCHNNGDRLDNRIENLRWDSKRNNSLDTVKHGTNPSTRRTHCPQGHSLTAPNLATSGLRRGKRECLSCNRARSLRRGISVKSEGFQEISDNYYKKIMA